MQAADGEEPAFAEGNGTEGQRRILGTDCVDIDDNPVDGIGRNQHGPNGPSAFRCDNEETVAERDVGPGPRAVSAADDPIDAVGRTEERTVGAGGHKDAVAVGNCLQVIRGAGSAWFPRAAVYRRNDGAAGPD